MTYPEQLKQKTNEELLEAHRINAQKGNKKDIDFANAIIMMRDCEAELLSRMEQPSQEHSNLNQQLFDYFQQEHDIMLLDGDYNEIMNILRSSQELFCPNCGKYKTMQGNGTIHQLCECGEPSQEHLKEALEEIQEKSQTACFQSNPHSYIKPMGEILKIATKALNQK